MFDPRGACRASEAACPVFNLSVTRTLSLAVNVPRSFLKANTTGAFARASGEGPGRAHSFTRGRRGAQPWSKR